jgi:hypothetical protein
MGEYPPMHFATREAYLYLVLQFSRALAGKAVWVSGHQNSKQVWRQPRTGIEEGSSKWKQWSMEDA